jgi:hypothetical protein
VVPEVQPLAVEVLEVVSQMVEVEAAVEVP